MLGGLFWTVSFDLGRHRLVLRYLGGASVLLGGALLAVCASEGMPPFWTWWDGPFHVAFGAVVLWGSFRVSDGSSEVSDAA